MNSNSQKTTKRKITKLSPEKSLAFRYESNSPKLLRFYRILENGPSLNYQQCQMLKNKYLTGFEKFKEAFCKLVKITSETFDKFYDVTEM